MTVQRQKSLLTLAAGLMVLASLALLVGGFVLPVRVDRKPLSPADSSARSKTDGAETKTSKLDWPQLMRLSAGDLLRPLYDEPARSSDDPNSTPRPQPALNIRLLGTAREFGHSMAMFMKPDGSVEWCAEGDRFKVGNEEIVLMKVEQHKVTLRARDNTMELKIPPSAAPTLTPAPTPRGRR
jgi:hypothetical protein